MSRWIRHWHQQSPTTKSLDYIYCYYRRH